MMDETVNSCLRPLLEGLTFTIAGHPEHLPHCVSAYEGDLFKKFGPEIRLGCADTKERRDSRRPDASIAKEITEAGGGVEGGAIFAYFERLSLSIHIAAPS